MNKIASGISAKALILCLLLGLVGSVGEADQGSLAISERVIQTVAMESANQSAYGQYLVASVIVNRARASKTSLESVCMKPKQFSAWNDRAWAKAWLGRHYTIKARGGAEKAIERAIISPFNGIDHYKTLGCRAYWAKGVKSTIIEGDHAFYDLN